MLIALCVAIAPVLTTAMYLHELAHAGTQLPAGAAHHDDAAHDHAHDHAAAGTADSDHDDTPAGLHAVLHGVHVCGHGLGIPPSLIPLFLSTTSLSPTVQLDVLRVSATSGLLFRPPRRA